MVFSMMETEEKLLNTFIHRNPGLFVIKDYSLFWYVCNTLGRSCVGDAWPCDDLTLLNLLDLENMYWAITVLLACMFVTVGFVKRTSRGAKLSPKPVYQSNSACKPSHCQPIRTNIPFVLTCLPHLGCLPQKAEGFINQS